MTYFTENTPGSMDDILASVQGRETPLSEYLGAKVAEGYDHTTSRVVADEFRIAGAEEKAYGRDTRPAVDPGELLFADPVGLENLTKADRPVLKKEEWEKSEHFRPGIKYEKVGEMTPVRAQILAEDYDERRYRQSLIERSPTGARSVLGFGAGMIGSLPDPVNLVGFGGVAAGRTLLKSAAIGAAENMAASAVTDAVVLPNLAARGEDVGFQDFVMDAMFAAALGGLFGLGGQALKNASETARFRAHGTERAILADSLEKAVADVVDGKQADVRGVLRLDVDAMERLREESVASRLEVRPVSDVINEVAGIRDRSITRLDLIGGEQPPVEWNVRTVDQAVNAGAGVPLDRSRDNQFQSLRADILGRDVQQRVNPEPFPSADQLLRGPDFRESPGANQVEPSIVPRDALANEMHEKRPVEYSHAGNDLHRNAIKKAVEPFVLNAPGAAPTKIIGRDEIPSHIAFGMDPKKIEGWTDRSTGEVFLVADNMTPGRAAEVWMHEQVGHYGLEKTFGDASELGIFLDSVAKRHGYTGPTARTMAEERVAQIAERMSLNMELSEADHSLWKELVEAARAWLVKHGLAEISDEDISRVLQNSLSQLKQQDNMGHAGAGKGTPSLQASEHIPRWGDPKPEVHTEPRDVLSRAAESEDPGLAMARVEYLDREGKLREVDLKDLSLAAEVEERSRTWGESFLNIAECAARVVE